MSNAQVLIFDIHGNDPVEVDVEVERLEWANQRVTEARFIFPGKSSKLTDDIIGPGRMVLALVEGIQPWGGVLWPPYSDRERGITLNVKSAQHYLASRFPHHTYDKDLTAGQSVVRMIRGSKLRGFSPINIDTAHIRLDGPPAKGHVRSELTILDNMKRLARRNGFEFWLDPTFINGNLRFDLFWRKRKNRLGSPIEIGRNASWGSVGSTLSGTIATAFYVTERDRQREQGRRTLIETNTPKELYGHWETAISVDIIHMGKQISRELQRAIQDAGKPSVRYRYFVKIDGLLSKEIEPGSLHLLNGPDMGFSNGQRGTSTTVRTMNVEYSEKSGMLDVLSKEWRGTEVNEWIP